MPDFPHLPLPKKIAAPYKYKGHPIDRKVSDTTTQNTVNRRTHGQTLLNAASTVTQQWNQAIEQRRAEGSPDLPNENTAPIFLKVDPAFFTTENLSALGIEVVAENEDGFIIGAGADHFTSLKDKIERFIQNTGKKSYNKPAQLWEIISGVQWRLDYILSPELNQKWDLIGDTDVLVVDVSIACDIKIPDEPSPGKEETVAHFRQRLQNWQTRKAELEQQRIDLEESRQVAFQRFAEESGARLLSSFVGGTDSFSCRLELTGLALKDIVLSYQYLFDVTDFTTLTYRDRAVGGEVVFQAVILPPAADSPKICVIDSGIHEGHRLLQPAIDRTASRSYLPNVLAGGDDAGGGGHGTKVAGAILYHSAIPTDGQTVVPFWLCSAKVLNSMKVLPKELFPPQLMQTLVNDYSDCKLFNLSITESQACRTGHMSKWASVIDNLIAAKDVLFIVATGNIRPETNVATNPGIKNYLASGKNYPSYLLTNAARIASPAQSCFAIAVGSVCSDSFEDEDRTSFGKPTNPSSFTRTGPGMWQMIKPDVVEYGGDFIRERAANPNLSTPSVTCVQVVNSTAGGGDAIGYDIGTSFTAPKVTHIAGLILKLLPLASANLFRALIVQSARLPGIRLEQPRREDIRYYGYGIPDRSRATENTETRITMIAEDRITAREAQIYTIKIPDAINRAGNDYDVLVEVTLAFTARTRRTRRRTNSYLATWADWQSSKLTESAQQFRKRVSDYVEQDYFDEGIEVGEGVIQWKIRESKTWGMVKDFRRQDSSLQKDWTIFKAYNLPDEFSLAVIGHKGWEKDATKQIPYALTVSFEVLNAQVSIYNLIRLENEVEVELRR